MKNGSIQPLGEERSYKFFIKLCESLLNVFSNMECFLTHPQHLSPAFDPHLQSTNRTGFITPWAAWILPSWRWVWPVALKNCTPRFATTPDGYKGRGAYFINWGSTWRDSGVFRRGKDRPHPHRDETLFVKIRHPYVQDECVRKG